MKKALAAAVLALALLNPALASDRGEDILKAVVKFRAQVPEGARTAGVLGTEREGNGILFDRRGYILTTGYLIIESESIEVTGPDGKKAKAVFAGYDHVTGFGVLRTENPLEIDPIELGDSAALKEGSPVIVAGYGGAEAAIGARVVSRREFVGYWEYLLDEAVYTAPAYPGFAGAALIGPDGKLLGVGSLFTRLALPGLGVLPCNVFIPIDLLKPILDDLIATGKPNRPAKPWMGISAEETHGRVFLTRITEGGPAEEAGLKPDDLVLMVNGQPIDGLADFYRKVWATGHAGVEVKISILKGTAPQDVLLRTGDRNKFLMMKPKRSL
jgi:S1-C subfamily serine protease